jgi:hypothetical protein
MEHERLRELLGKYFEGLTSEDEELLLKELLNTGSLPDAVKDEYGYLAFTAAKIPEPSAGFESRLEEVTHLTADITPQNKGKRWLTISGTVAAVAAAIWIISAILQKKEGRDTYSDPLMAMAEVRTVLLNVSDKMNAGTAQLQMVGNFADRPDELRGLATINELVGKNLSRLRYLGELAPPDNDTETD